MPQLWHWQWGLAVTTAAAATQKAMPRSDGGQASKISSGRAAAALADTDQPPRQLSCPQAAAADRAIAHSAGRLRHTGDNLAQDCAGCCHASDGGGLASGCTSSGVALGRGAAQQRALVQRPAHGRLAEDHVPGVPAGITHTRVSVTNHSGSNTSFPQMPISTQLTARWLEHLCHTRV